MEKDALFDIFKIAIDKEHDAHEFYKKAAKNTKNQEARDLFEKFAGIELEHEKALQRLYREIKEGQGQ